MGATSIKLMLSNELEVDLGNSPVNSPQAQAVILCRCLVSITIRPLTRLTTLMLPQVTILFLSVAPRDFTLQLHDANARLSKSPEAVIYISSQSQNVCVIRSGVFLSSLVSASRKSHQEKHSTNYVFIQKLLQFVPCVNSGVV